MASLTVTMASLTTVPGIYYSREYHGHSWWHHQMLTFSTSLALCAGNSPVNGEFPSQRPVTRSIHVFFDLRLNKRLSKQSWFWWFETPLWRHYDVSCGISQVLCTQFTMSCVLSWFGTTKFLPYPSGLLHWCWDNNNAIITLLLRQNDITTSFWRRNDAIIALCVRWEATLKAYGN